MARGRECTAVVLGLALGLVIESTDLAALARDTARLDVDGGARNAPGEVGLPEGSQGARLPAGHPPVEDSNPHAVAHTVGSTPEIFEPPEDTEKPDPSLPAGTIAVELLDLDGRALPGEMVTLGILINSISKGDSRKHLEARTDDGGQAVFGGLEAASNIAYRVSSGFQGGAFAARPFQLEPAKARRVVLHVYPVTHDLQQALVIAEVTIAAEVRDDRIQLEEVLTVHNLGRTAWQPEAVHLALPEGVTGFSVQPSMSDQGVDEVDGSAKLRGTFSPGHHTVDFRWQLPWSGGKDLDFDVGLPPHVAVARVLMPAAADIQLAAAGFPPSEIRRDARGQRFLFTERQLRPDDPKLTMLRIGIHGLPTPGPERQVALAIAACTVAAGIAFAFVRRSRDLRADPVPVRAALLEDLAALERARSASQVGPKTYEKVRMEIIDAIAHTLAPAPDKET
jgi:hypothetical protein